MKVTKSRRPNVILRKWRAGSSLPTSEKSDQRARMFKRREIELQKKLAAVEKENADLQMVVRHREHQVRLLYSSRSWRITKPIRALSVASTPIRLKLKVGAKIRNLKHFLKMLFGPSYPALCAWQHKVIRSQVSEIKNHIGVMLSRPLFSVVIDARGGMKGLKATLRSVREQIYTEYSIVVLMNDDATITSQHEFQFATKLELKNLAGEYLVILECGQWLASSALYEFASALEVEEQDLIYADDDSIDHFGRRHSPFYKPAWSPDYLETFNYIGFVACFRKDRVLDGEIFVGQYDFILAYTERPCRILHIPKVLGHRTVDDRSLSHSDAGPLSRRLERTGRAGQVNPHKIYKGCYEIKLDLQSRPLVSVIIPTAGKTIAYESRSVDLITNVVLEIQNKSTYKNLEFIIIHNDDLADDQVRQLRRAGCKLLAFLDSEVNISKKLNLGARHATGDILLLMNDDIEIVEPEWIERMLEHFEKPHIGVVGARLMYPNGKLQHAGVVFNYGNPDHVRRMFDANESGYFFSTCGVKNFLAVTGAVMMTRASTYRAVGGYTEKLAISFNDVDYCLKVSKLGLSTVYAPAANLIHLESQSRIPTLNTEELMWLYTWWGSETNPDPYYNELFLTVAPPTYIPTINPRMI